MRDALGIAVAIVIALLTQIITPLSSQWWAGMMLAGAIAVWAAGHLLWEIAKRWADNAGGNEAAQRLVMAPADIGFNVALLASVASILSAIRRSPRLAIAACLVCLIAVGFDVITGPPRKFVWQGETSSGHNLLMAGLHGTPMGWGDLFLNDTVVSPSSRPVNIRNMSVFGGNTGDREVRIDDAYFLSGIDGSTIGVKIVWGAQTYKVTEIRPIPPGALLFLMSDPVAKDPDGMMQDEFLSKWSIVTLVVKYDGVEHRIPFDETAVKAAIPRALEPAPHISPLKGD